MSKRVIVIGGGASGMTAAIFAARQGAAVTLLEHMDRVGKKILSTGNGKCNLTNRRMDASCYRSSAPEFPMEVLGRFGEPETEAFFEELGIVLKDRNGYLYPASGQASSVLDALREELSRLGVNIVTECGEAEVAAPGSGKGGNQEWTVLCKKGRFCSDALILAAGSKAAPSTGSDGSGYDLAKRLGHRIIRPLPALVQLRCREKFFKQISGVRADACVSIWADGERLAYDQGELQLTDYGISGIPVFQVSRFASVALSRGAQVKAEIDFYPELDRKELGRFLRERRQLLGDRNADSFLTGWFNKKLALLFLRLAGISLDRNVSSLTETQLSELGRRIKQFETEIVETNPFPNAQICCGGVDVREVNPHTMESKKRKGLYLAGELLDVDGICGGYNLQWAWSTGALAGIHGGR